MTKQERYNRYFMDVALRTAQNSYAVRSKVGAVLTKDNHVLACGWNGRVAGQPNTCEEWADWLNTSPGNSKILVDNTDENAIMSAKPEYLKTRADVVHAEANIIYFCAKHGIKTDETVLYITLSPCATCALAIIQAGIKKVYYHEEYRDPTGLNILKNSGIEVELL